MASTEDKPGNPLSPRLLDEVRNRIRTKHYSRRMEESYTHWIKRFILFHHKRHPREMGAAEVEAFLSSLDVDRQVSASTLRQAFAAILFLYKEIPGLDLPCAKRWLKPGRYDRPGVPVFPPP